MTIRRTDRQADKETKRDTERVLNSYYEGAEVTKPLIEQNRAKRHRQTEAIQTETYQFNGSVMSSTENTSPGSKVRGRGTANKENTV